MSILVLTSEQNFVWHSMQEIIPFIETSWVSRRTEQLQVNVLDVDKTSLSGIVSLALKSTHIVLTCFNHKIARIAAFIRLDLKLPVNFIFHVHNMATIAFWPFRKWCSESFFLKNDLFVSSCTNDINTLLSILPEAHIYLQPFELFEEPSKKAPAKSLNSNVDSISYIGRISSQKNLHNLILGYALARLDLSSLPRLDIFGKEDLLGSPNMGFKDADYQLFLEELVSNLNLQNHVTFRGHVDRKYLRDYLENNSTLGISTSLHSDENFGMAILQSLESRNFCLISNWGGHTDFYKKYPLQVELINVNQTSFGPVLSAYAIKNSLKDFFLKKNMSIVNIKESLEKNLVNIADYMDLNFSSVNLSFTSLGNRIFQAQQTNSVSDPMGSTKIFSDYSDSLFHEISNHYIGNTNISSASLPSDFSFKLVPWVNKNETYYLISDPHKGNFKIPISQSTENDFKLLFDLGYAY